MTVQEFISKPHMCYDTVSYPIQTGEHKEAVARFNRVCRGAVRNAKADQAVELANKLVKQIAARRSQPIPDALSAGPTAEELFRAFQPAPDKQTQTCAQSEAAYAARNPHKKDAAKKGFDAYLRWLYEKISAQAAPEESAMRKELSAILQGRTTADATTFEARCRESEAAYAARNPHKRKAGA